LNALYEMRTKT